MMSIFNTARPTDLGSKSGYRTLTNLKVSSDLLIHHAGRKHSDHNVMIADLTPSQGGVPSWKVSN